MGREPKLIARLCFVAKEVGAGILFVAILAVLVSGVYFALRWLIGLVPAGGREAVFVSLLVLTIIASLCCLVYLIVAPLCWWIRDMWDRSAAAGDADGS
jgi:hypothetical protein